MNPRDLNYIYDKPVRYWSSSILEKDRIESNFDKSILIYPIGMREYYHFQYYSDCLLLENDEKPTEKRLTELNMSMLEYRKAILSMSYLEYLYFSSTVENQFLSKLHGLLCLSLKRDLEFDKDVWYGYEENNGKRGILKIDGIVYRGQDFDDIRVILSEYNSLELPNMMTQKEIRDATKLIKQIKSGDTKMADMEDLIVALSVSTGFELEYLYDLPIRKFSKMLERIDAKLHYTMYATASLSGMVEFKDKSVLKHWLANLKTNDLDDTLLTLDSVKDKVSMEDLKK